MPLNVLSGNALAEVSLDRIHTQVKQPFQAAAKPFARFGICEVNYSHACLPQVPLPNIAIGFLQEVAFLRSVLEDWASLSYVWIGPDRDFVEETSFLSSLDLSLRVWEVFGIPYKVAPVEGTKPETVEMEDFDGDL